MNHWQKAVLHNKGKCLFCFNNYGHNTGHKMCNYPIMKSLKFELDSAGASREVASCVATKGTTPAPPPPPESRATNSCNKSVYPRLFFGLDGATT